MLKKKIMGQDNSNEKYIPVLSGTETLQLIFTGGSGYMEEAAKGGCQQVL